MSGGLQVIDLADIDIRAVEWLDRPFWQRACFTLLAGKKGCNKGTLLARLAAECTTGRLYSEPKRVVLISSEDSMSLDFKPRYVAARGDQARGALTVVGSEFQLPTDIEHLEQLATDLGNVGLIVIDPIANHVGATNTDNDGGVRNAIGALNDLADRLDALIVGVRHLRKDVNAGPLTSVLGSTAWVDTPRAVIGMVQDDEDEWLRHYQVLAGNRSGRSEVRAARVSLTDVPPAKDITCIVDLGLSDKTLDEVLAGQPKEPSGSEKARTLILDRLDDGPENSDVLDAIVAEQTGLKSKTVRNVRSKLADQGLIRSVPIRDAAGKAESWEVHRTAAPRPDKGRGRDLDSHIPTPEGASGKTPAKTHFPEPHPGNKLKGSGLCTPTLAHPHPDSGFTGSGSGSSTRSLTARNPGTRGAA